MRQLSNVWSPGEHDTCTVTDRWTFLECQTTMNNVNRFVNTALRFPSKTFITVFFPAVWFSSHAVNSALLFWVVILAETNPLRAPVTLDFIRPWSQFSQHTFRFKTKLAESQTHEVRYSPFVFYSWAEETLFMTRIRGGQMVLSIDHNNTVHLIKMTLSRRGKHILWLQIQNSRAAVKKRVVFWAINVSFPPYFSGMCYGWLLVHCFQPWFTLLHCITYQPTGSHSGQRGSVVYKADQSVFTWSSL